MAKLGEPLRLGSDPTCPECECTMVVKINSGTGRKFWSCSTYPDCKGTLPYDEPDDPADEYLSPSERARKNDRRRWRD